ncbi:MULTISPECIES: hypothetical protein [unclassified Sphingomonas]|uniref:hypothetical protein n=1 Tax=unclassified Sphingomonas TaxID=196159 RepID=UPI0006FEC00C|nr:MULTISPECIES: hypothetical protein [unclassified Sphingomonas]KQX20850.1 hypothetical protein ASD17_08150 [Sphingomonas sp. Root1294]KQY68696.1 hypothetical protein ASD39_04665 [Sphingomonas sp. Root50]KRB88100.1 hypothetical protein ASE22_21840 [Sphingomonas sp. Root720]
MLKIFVAVAGFALTVVIPGPSAAAPPPKEFYQEIPGTENYTERSSTPPIFIKPAGDPESIVNYMWERGFVPIGSSAFSGPMGKREVALKFGKEIGASHIVYLAQYEQTKTGMKPVILPNMSATTASASGVVSGRGGLVSSILSGSASTFGFSSTLTPWSVDLYEQTLLFFAPVKPGGTGMMLEPLPEELRRKLGTNRAQAVRALRIGYPAYEADIMVGDIIVEVDSQPASVDRLIAAQGRIGEHKYKIRRGDDVIEKSLTITQPR